MLAEIPWGTLPIALFTLLAVAPIRRPRRLAVFSWITSCAPNEVPFLFLYLIVFSTIPGFVGGNLSTRRGQIALAVTVLTVAGLVVVIRRALRSGPAVNRALADALGPRWRSQIDPALAARLRRHLPWARILTIPWMFGRHDVERIADIAYGDGGRSNLLDLYRHRSRPSDAPTLIYLHGGRFRWGRKNREARPLLYHLASQGWTCISANYHLSSLPAEGFPQHLVDTKNVIAWVRSHGREYGADPDTIFLVGASAGAHLAAMAALTPNDPMFQPGFETADTSIAAGVGLYGYYGQLGGDEQPSTSPSDYVNAQAPPFFVVHGDHDTYTPVQGARSFVERLRAVSAGPVVYAELPGAQHSFDLFHSIRFETVIDAIEAFAAWVRTPTTTAAATDDTQGHRAGFAVTKRSPAV